MYMPGGYVMGCMCKNVLRILAGIALMLASASIISYSPWLIVGLYLALRGVMPMVCKCEGGCCTVEKKKK